MHGETEQIEIRRDFKKMFEEVIFEIPQKAVRINAV